MNRYWTGMMASAIAIHQKSKETHNNHSPGSKFPHQPSKPKWSSSQVELATCQERKHQRSTKTPISKFKEEKKSLCKFAYLGWCCYQKKEPWPIQLVVPSHKLSVGAALPLAKLVPVTVGFSSEQFASSRSIGSSMQMASPLISHNLQGPSTYSFFFLDNNLRLLCMKTKSSALWAVSLFLLAVLICE